jgi:hypothetical protein
MRTILSAFLFMVAVLGGGTMALSLLAQTESRSEHAAKLRKLAQQANQLAAEAEPAPLPPMPANVVSALKPPMALPSPMVVKSFNTTHPSGAIIDITLPTNVVAITIPGGWYLTNRPLFSISLEELVDFKRTNASAVIWYFQRQ